MIIGIIGKIGSGKSSVSNFLNKKYNAIVFSCDIVAKEIIRNDIEKYKKFLSDEIFDDSNLLEECRIELHKDVFNRIFENINNLTNKSNKHIDNFINFAKLSSIFNNILNKINFNIKKNENNINNFNNKNNHYSKKNESSTIKEQIFVIESALPSQQMIDNCDKVIYVDCDYDVRVKRLKKDRNYSEAKIKMILDSQIYYEKFYSKADIIIKNNGSIIELEEKIKEVMDEIYFTGKQ